MKEIYYVSLLPAIAGLLGYLIKRLRTEFCFLSFFLALYFSIKIFVFSQSNVIAYQIATIAGVDIRYYLDDLSGLVLLFNAIFALLIWVYALRSMSKTKGERVYHLYLALVLAIANSIAVCGNLIFLVVLWNILTLCVYGFMQTGKNNGAVAGRKTIMILGIADLVMILGITLLSLRLAQNPNFPLEPRISLVDPWMIIALIMILTSVLAKSGIMPLHGWIPEASKVAPASTVAFVTVIINSLLGTYLLIRISYFVFDISSSLVFRCCLMAIGALSVIVAVIKAFMQKDAMTFVSFQSIAQSGYVVLGIGTGLEIGIAAAFFHMINIALSKACLFMSLGSIGFRTKSTKFAELGGLSKKLPLTMVAFVIAALALADVPPLNGFYSKWLLYQAVIQFAKISNVGLIFLVVMIFGGILTLVGFLKVIYLVFLRVSPKKLEWVYEPRFEMVTPTLIFSAACIVFGLFANFVLGKIFHQPVLFAVLDFSSWSQTLPTLLIILAIFLGVMVFLVRKGLCPDRFRLSNEVFWNKGA